MPKLPNKIPPPVDWRALLLAAMRRLRAVPQQGVVTDEKLKRAAEHWLKNPLAGLHEMYFLKTLAPPNPELDNDIPF